MGGCCTCLPGHAWARAMCTMWSPGDRRHAHPEHPQAPRPADGAVQLATGMQTLQRHRGGTREARSTVTEHYFTIPKGTRIAVGKGDDGWADIAVISLGVDADPGHPIRLHILEGDHARHAVLDGK